MYIITNKQCLIFFFIQSNYERLIFEEAKMILLMLLV